MTALRRNGLGLWALAYRDLLRFFRQKSRIAGALGQPLLLWAIYGLGFANSFRLPGSEQSVSYLQYLYPGVLVMIVLFSAIFSTMSIIEDRHTGFLQLALAAPISRASLVLGKATGGTFVSLLQGAVFLLFLPLSGYAPSQVHWISLLLTLIVGSMALTVMGFAIAWKLDSVQGYHAVMMLLLIPMWILSGAMFPISEGLLGTLMRINPMTYVVEAVRYALTP